MRCAFGGLMVGCVCFAGIAQLAAAPIDFKLVSADAKWLGHVDVDAMRQSKVVQNAYHKAQEKHPHMAMGFEMGAKMFGMDLRHDLHGITVYGSKLGKHEGVMLVNAKCDREKLTKLAEKAADHKTEQYRDYTLHSWTSKHHGKSHPSAGTFHGDDWLVFANNFDSLKAALDVINGKAGNVGDNDDLAGRVPVGSTVMFRVTGISDAKLDKNCPIAKQTKSFRFVVGENDGESFYRARANMTSEDAAYQIKQIVEGLRALGMLHADEKGDKLVSALEAKTEGSEVTVLWKGSADDVWEQMQLHAKKFEEHRAKMREKHGDRGRDRKDKDDKDDDDDDRKERRRGDRKPEVEDF